MRQARLFNARFFGGVLPEIPVHWRRASSYYGMWHFDATKRKRFPNGLIVLSTNIDVPGGWRGILLHEMLHAWLFYTVEAESDGDTDAAEDHGEAFTEAANRIGAQLKLPLVTEHDSWSWPWGVLDEDDLTEIGG